MKEIFAGTAEILIKALTKENPLYFEEKEELPEKSMTFVFAIAMILVFIMIILLRVNIINKRKK